MGYEKFCKFESAHRYQQTLVQIVLMKEIKRLTVVVELTNSPNKRTGGLNVVMYKMKVPHIVMGCICFV